jgi:hypothetical protein
MLPRPRDHEDSRCWQNLSLSLTLDNNLLLADTLNGEPVPIAEILSLASMAQALFLVTTLETRQMDLIKDRRRAWLNTSAIFDELVQVWKHATLPLASLTDVCFADSVDSANCHDPNISWLRCRLEHFYELAHDMTELYDISEQDAREFAERRRDLPEEEEGNNATLDFSSRTQAITQPAERPRQHAASLANANGKDPLDPRVVKIKGRVFYQIDLGPALKEGKTIRLRKTFANQEEAEAFSQAQKMSRTASQSAH